jgi:diguanylate cyclase (GGDEF)-like protein
MLLCNKDSIHFNLNTTIGFEMTNNNASTKPITEKAALTNWLPPEYLPLHTEKINESLVKLTYQQASVGLLTAFICASLIWYRLHTYANLLNLNIWYGSITVITLLRISLVRIYFSQKHPEQHSHWWKDIFIITTSLGGISWGLMAFYLLPYANSNDHILILTIIAGITAAAVAFIAGILPAALLYITTALIPLCIHYFFKQQDYLIGTSIFIYLIFLLVQSKRIHSMLLNGLMLQFELKDAKDHDPLTKAANRNLFNVTLAYAIESAKKAETKFALIYFDLNKFKLVNDAYGHQVGDQILIAFVERLKTLFKEKDAIARLGGDEFAVIEKLHGDKDINLFIKKIDEALESPALVNDTKMNIHASFGISLYPEDGHDMQTLLRVADERMYGVKKR